MPGPKFFLCKTRDTGFSFYAQFGYPTNLQEDLCFVSIAINPTQNKKVHRSWLKDYRAVLLPKMMFLF